MGVKHNIKYFYGYESTSKEDIDWSHSVSEGEGPSELYDLMVQLEEEQFNLDTLVSGDWYNARYDSMVLGFRIEKSQLNDAELHAKLKESLIKHDIKKWLKDAPEEPSLVIMQYIW